EISVSSLDRRITGYRRKLQLGGRPVGHHTDGGDTVAKPGSIPAGAAAFSRMLEVSSLGSDSSRHARLEGARVLADLSPAGSPWLEKAAPWPAIATLHHTIAGLLAAEGQPDRGELWLRAALNRAMSGPAATRLAAQLEQRR